MSLHDSLLSHLSASTLAPYSLLVRRMLLKLKSDHVTPLPKILQCTSLHLVKNLYTGLKDPTDLVPLCCSDLILNTPLQSHKLPPRPQGLCTSRCLTLSALPLPQTDSWMAPLFPLSLCSNVTFSMKVEKVTFPFLHVYLLSVSTN